VVIPLSTSGVFGLVTQQVALTTIIDDWLKSKELGKSVCSVFLDVRKAFDSVPHTRLIEFYIILAMLFVDHCCMQKLL